MTTRGPFKWSYTAWMTVPADIVGVYLFWYRPTGKCIYVGMASNQPIRDRLRQHWRRSHNEGLRLWMRVFGDDLELCYAPISRRRVRTVERRLIRLLSPEANEQHKR